MLAVPIIIKPDFTYRNAFSVFGKLLKRGKKIAAFEVFGMNADGGIDIIIPFRKRQRRT